jgi:CRP-like cAMP-binding protein
MAHFEATIRKLRNSIALDAQDIASITALPIDIKELPAHTWILREGEKPSQCCLLIECHIVRSKTSEEGKLQIL